MSELAFDAAKCFNDDYLWFYEPNFTDAQNRIDANQITATLGLNDRSSVLDAPCGHGRISNLLADDGHTVTGVDITPLFVDKASADAQALGVEVDYRLGDLRNLPVEGPFDAVICWFTSFGYFDDAGNKEVLAEYARVLKTGGQLIIETLHHDGFVRNYTPAPAATTVERGDDLLTDVTTFDPNSGRIETDRTVFRSGETRRSHHSIRLPTIPEFDDWLAEAGFSRRSFTDRIGQPLTYDSWRMVAVATK